MAIGSGQGDMLLTQARSLKRHAGQHNPLSAIGAGLLLRRADSTQLPQTSPQCSSSCLLLQGSPAMILTRAPCWHCCCYGCCCYPAAGISAVTGCSRRRRRCCCRAYYYCCCFCCCCSFCGLLRWLREVLGIRHAGHPPHGVLVAALQVDVQPGSTQTVHTTSVIGRQPK